MSTVYSKPSLTNPELSEFSDTTHSESFDSVNSDLCEKIKTAIGKIKLNKCFPTRKRYAKFPCSVCEMLIQMEFTVQIVFNGYIVNVMVLPNRNIKYLPKNQMITHLLVLCVQLNTMLKFFH